MKTASDKIIGIVGPSKSGKSTLKIGLEEMGYTVRHIAQEHSFAPSMWRTIADPDILIYLDVSFAQASKRGELNWKLADFEEELRRLEHARQFADCRIRTDDISPQAVFDQVISFMLPILNKKE